MPDICLESCGLRAIATLGILICTKPSCVCEVPSYRKPFIRHLRLRHSDLSASDRFQLWSEAQELIKSFPNASAARDMYRSGSYSAGILDSIDGLPIVEARKCPDCNELVEAVETLRQHVRKRHGRSLTRTSATEIATVKCQSLHRRKTAQRNLYRVRIAPQPAAQAQASESADQTDIQSDYQREIAEKISTYDPGHLSSREYTARHERTKSTFVFIAKVDEVLARLGLSKEDAWRLPRPISASATDLIAQRLGALTADLVALMSIADELGSRGLVFRALQLDVTPGGYKDKHTVFAFLRSTTTLTKYAQEARCVVLIACRVVLHQSKYPKVKISRALGESVHNLLAYMGSEDERRQELIFRVYDAVMFEPSENIADFGELFATVVRVCLCVTGKTETQIQYALGINVSPKLSGIMYFASCCAVLKILKYCEPSEQQMAHAAVKEAMEPNTANGIRVLSDLRVICANLRHEENLLHIYHNNTELENCGVIEGHQLSAESVGKAVHALHEEMETHLLEEIFKGKRQPASFETEWGQLQDDHTNTVLGYSVVSDLRNKGFITRIIEWFSSILTYDLGSLAAREEWKKAVRHYHRKMLTAMHLAGGGPARGTEIGSMALRNTVASQRNVFVVNEEVFTCTAYNKTRNMKRGNVRVISRHMDRRTSYLVKQFLCIVHPMYCILTDREEMETRERQEVEQSLLMGLMSAENVSREITSCFGRHDIPMNFSQYRQWQRGYAKNKGPGSILKKASRLMSSNDADDDEEDYLEGIAMIEQGGHSVYTAATAYAQQCKFGEFTITGEHEQIELFRQASHEWHKDLKLDYGQQPKEQLRSTDSKSTRRVSLTEETLDVFTKRVTESIRKAMQTVRPGEPSDAMSVKEKQGGAVARRLFGEAEETNEPTSNMATEWHIDAEDTEMPTVLGIAPQPPVTADVRIDDAAARNRMREKCKAATQGFAPREALCKFLGQPKAVLRGKEQELAMKAVAENRNDVAIILRTGEGKTAVVAAPMLYEHGLSVWISPLRALRKETEERLRSGRLSVYSRDTCPVTVEGTGHVIVASPEELVHTQLGKIATRFDERGLLNRVVIDEFHLPLLSASYRESMHMLQGMNMWSADCPRVFLSATAPHEDLENMLRMYNVPRVGVRVIRGDPCRANLRIEVDHLENGKVATLAKAVCTKVTAIMEYFENKGVKSGSLIVVALTTGDCDLYWNMLRMKLKSKSQVMHYHSKLASEKRDETSRAWASSGPRGWRVMVATEGFTTGTDKLNVRGVVIAGTGRSMIEMWQAMGRGGRDGEQCIASVLFHRGHAARCQESESEADHRVQEVIEWASNLCVCRREVIESRLGGAPQQMTCIDRRRNRHAIELCDYCEKTETDRLAQARAPTLQQASDRVQIEEVEESVRREAKRLRKETTDASRELNKLMRAIGKELVPMCIYCLFNSLTSKNMAELTSREIQNMKQQARKCVERHCIIGKTRCLRCKQLGHRVRECPNLPSVQRGGQVRCRECYLLSVSGVSVHESSEFGKRVCPYKPLLHLVLLVAGSGMERSRLFERLELPAEMRERRFDMRTFISYIVEDKVGSPAKLFEVMKEVYDMYLMAKLV